MAKIYCKDGLCISAGCVHGNGNWLAQVEGGKVVYFNEELNLPEEEKKKIESFVDEAVAAPEDKYE